MLADAGTDGRGTARIERFIVVGAGAVGATIGARLFEHGHDVVLVARGAHLEAMRRDGLCFRDPDRSRCLAVPVAGAAGEVRWRDGDVAVLATKGQDAVAAMDDVRAAAGPAVPVVCAQNGVDNERQALRRFAGVYGMCVLLPATHVEPGVVEAPSLPIVGVLDVGRYPRGSDAIIEDVAAALDGSGFRSAADPDIMRWKYQKLLLNIATAVRAICDVKQHAADEDAARRALEDGIAAEARACFAAARIGLPTPDEVAARWTGALTHRPIPGREGKAGGSSWQSLTRGLGSIEADHLNGEIVLLGRLHGVPTPLNAGLAVVAAEVARRRERPGTMRPSELAARIGSVAATVPSWPP
ncbi:MAG: 2-dehydropantoate 2-reductase N-terminal domain-containing protein [Ilumatobacteraceae bacterium]